MPLVPEDSGARGESGGDTVIVRVGARVPKSYALHYALSPISARLKPVESPGAYEKVLLSRDVSDGETRTPTGDTTIFSRAALCLKFG
jgi:hypothetical protein